MTAAQAIPIEDSPQATQHELLKLPSSLRSLFISRTSSPSPPSAASSPPRNFPKLVEPRVKLSSRIKDQLNIKGSIKGPSFALGRMDCTHAALQINGQCSLAHRKTMSFNSPLAMALLLSSTKLYTGLLVNYAL